MARGRTRRKDSCRSRATTTCSITSIATRSPSSPHRHRIRWRAPPEATVRQTIEHTFACQRRRLQFPRVLVERAFTKAARQFEGATRKQTEIPYLSHLMSVAALVMEAGGDEVQVAAAFLHDSAEDKGGEAELGRIEAEFGPEVAAIVRDLSDSLVDTTAGQVKEAWSLRKQRYIEHLREAPERSLVVSAADK